MTRITGSLCILLLHAGAFSRSDASAKLGSRQLAGEDLTCPFDEERLYYNIDINILATAHNCDEYDLAGIGYFLQNLVSEIEASIPEYENTERMETTVCPVPEEQDVTRFLQEAPQQAQSTRKRRGGRKRYTYKGSGRCRRCKANNSDRRLRKKRGGGVTVEMVCQYADKANHAFEEFTAVELKANEKVISLEEKARECGSDLYLEKELLREAKQRLTWIGQSQQDANEEARKANAECNKASRSKSPKTLKKCLNKARKFEYGATKALEQATTDYGEVAAITGSFFCDEHVQQPLDYDSSWGQQHDDPWEPIEGGKTFLGYEEVTYGGSPFTYEEEGNLASNSSLEAWLNKLADMLDQRVAEALIAEYGDSPDRAGCILKDVFGYTEVDAFQDIMDAPNYIESEEDCNAI